MMIDRGSVGCRRSSSRISGRCTAALFALTLLLTAAPVGHARAAQSVNTPGPMNPPPMFPGQANPLNSPMGPGVPPRMAAAAERARENERQKKLVADSDKLLALATELHADIARTDKNILSVDVMRRAEAIEKLARSVKERMRGQQ